MRRSMKEMVFFLVLLVATTAPQLARAGAKEEARKHYDRAVELVDDGQLAEAIIEFQRSYDLTKHFSVLYNIGQVYVSLAKPVEAIAAYEGYLVGGGKNISAARRAEVENELVRQKARLATLVLRILPDGATVRVDGNEIGKASLAQPLSVGIGEHVVTATAEGHEPAMVKLTVASEDRRTVELALTPIPEKKAEPLPVAVPAAATVVSLPVTPVAPSLAPTAASPPLLVVPAPALQPSESTIIDAPAGDRASARLQVTGLATGAVGIVGLVTGTVCWYVAKSRHDDAVAYWNTGSNDAKAQSLQGQAQNYATAASTALVAGGAFSVLGAVLYLSGASDTHTASSGARAHFAPAVGPEFAGINARGSW